MVCWRPERSQGMPLHAPGEDEVQVKKIGVSFVSLSRLLLPALALAPALAPTPLSLPRLLDYTSSLQLHQQTEALIKQRQSPKRVLARSGSSDSNSNSSKD